MKNANRRADPSWRTLSVPEAGKKYLGVGRDASYAAAHAGLIPVIRVGKLLRVPEYAMEQRLLQLANGGQAAAT
jgi:excisionase family DNA binding protein